ncbi:MAG: hypothetical protein Q8O46_00760, partial [bacterium]|nr:hypothetical protein [bacterium]
MVGVYLERETAENQGLVELATIPTFHSCNSHGHPVLIREELLIQLDGKYAAIMGEVVACVVHLGSGFW